MHESNRQPDRPSSRPAQHLIWIGASLAAVTVIGITDPVFGGLGKALFWVGVIVAPMIFVLAGAIGVLGAKHPEATLPLESVWSACVSALAILVLALLILELQFRASHPLPKIRFSSTDPMKFLQVPDPLLSWRGAANFVQKMEFITGTREFRTNSLGFRDIEQLVDDERPRVVILGDSFAVGWGADAEDGIAARLRRVLPKAQFFNASWQGYGKDQIASSYGVLARPLRPKVVVMLFLVNPLTDTSRPIFDGIRKPYYLLDGGALKRAGTPVLYHQGEGANRQLYSQWQRARITNPRAALDYLCGDFLLENSALGRHIAIGLYWREVNDLGLPPIDAIETLVLAQAKAEIEADGGHLIVVPAPHREFFQLTRDPCRSMQRHLDGYRSLGIDTVDVTPLLLEDWRTCFDRELHPNAHAIERIHQAIAERIRAKL